MDRGLRRSARVLTPWLAVWLVACATPFAPPAPRDWHEVRSEHFVFYTDLDREFATSLAVELERFRSAVIHFTNVERLDAPVPVRIFVFEKPSTYRKFRPSPNAAGFILPTSRSYDVAFASRDKTFYETILFHEYVHFLMGNQNTLMYPRWYDEGFAEFLSTLLFEEERLIVGSASPDRVRWLFGRFPADKVLGSEKHGQYGDLSPLDQMRYYAWSWLLVHYLSMDLAYSAGDSFSQRMARYIDAVGEGTAPDEAFAVAWGFDTDELEDRLADLIRTGVARGALPLDRLHYSSEVRASGLSVGEASRLLGELALHVGKPRLAQAYFKLALETQPQDPRALAGLGDTYKFQDDLEQARTFLDRALALAPDDPLTLLDHGQLFLHQATESPDDPQRSVWLETARADFTRVLERRPDQPEALATLGMSYLVEGEDPALAVAPLERAFEILPRDWFIQSELMKAYAEVGRGDDAWRIGRRLLVAAHSREQQREIRALLDELP